MLTVGRLIKIIFYVIILILVLKGGLVLYNNFYQQSVLPQPKTQQTFDISAIANEAKQPNDSYDFKRMLSLLEACEKVKYIDHAQFSRPGELEPVDTKTLRSLGMALKGERKRLKHFIWQVRSHSRQSVPSKRMKALKYYMRVMELYMQDVEEIICTRADGGVIKK